MFDLQKHLGAKAEEITAGVTYKENAPRLTMANGESLSVQASRTHYCSPREDAGPYSKVEVGFPSVAPPDSWAEYFDGDWENEDRTGSVYGYVPIELVAEFIEANGGIDV